MMTPFLLIDIWFIETGLFTSIEVCSPLTHSDSQYLFGKI